MKTKKAPNVLTKKWDATRPLFRVLEDGHDATNLFYSRRARNNRFNDSTFSAQYFCCSLQVAESVALNFYGSLGLTKRTGKTHVLPGKQLRVHDFRWEGDYVDLSCEEGIRLAGFDPKTYPQTHPPARQTSENKEKTKTRKLAAELFRSGHAAIMYRSASVRRMTGRKKWTGDPHNWCELVVFPESNSLSHATRPAPSGSIRILA